jgi:signal recognition particle subunit SRP72
LCRKTLEEDDLTEEEMESELAVIRVQLAYCLQLAKREKEALALYNTVLKNRPDDPALVAVACNNVVAINRDQNVFDSKKKMKSVPSGVPSALSGNQDVGVAAKLTRRQRASMAFNHCVLAYFVSQVSRSIVTFDERVDTSFFRLSSWMRNCLLSNKRQTFHS